MDEFNALIIPRSTVEAISKQEIGNLMIGFTWRANLWQKPSNLIQVGLIQVVGMGIIAMIVMIPVDRILNITNPTRTPTERIEQSIWVDGLTSLAILGGINYWIFQRGKRLRKLQKLVVQIEQYNQIISSIITLTKVGKLTNSRSEFDRMTSILDILTQTRHNLLMALEIDLYLRQHPSADELSISIAHNLLDLQHLAEQPQLSEYSTLLTQAWEIGMSVYQETNLGISME